jgi:hypothetical protein
MKKKTERRKEPLGPTDQNSQQQIITLKKKDEVRNKKAKNPHG